MRLFRPLTEFHPGADHGARRHRGVGPLSLVGHIWADGCLALGPARAAYLLS